MYHRECVDRSTIINKGIKKQKNTYNWRHNLGILFLANIPVLVIFTIRGLKKTPRNKSRRNIRCIPIPLAARNRIRATVLFHSSGCIYVFTTRVAFFQNSCLYYSCRKEAVCMCFSVARESEYDLFMRGYYIYFDAFYRHRIFACRIVHHYQLIHRNSDKETSYLSLSLWQI